MAGLGGGARARARASAARHAGSAGTAGARPSGTSSRRRRRSTRSRATTPALLFSKDYHSLWLNSAALARAERRPRRSTGGVVERDEAGEPTGILREESAWQFRARFAMPTEDEFVEAMREGLRIAASRGVVAIHDKDGWLGAPRIFQRSPSATGSRFASGSPSRTSGCRSSRRSASTPGSATTSCGSAT